MGQPWFPCSWFMAKPSNSFLGDFELSSFFRLSGPEKWKNTNFLSRTTFQRQRMVEPSNFMLSLQLFCLENLVTYYI